MNAALVLVLSLITSAATALGTVYMVQRYDWFKAEPAVKQQAVPNLIGLTETDARTNLEAVGLKLVIAGREPTSGAEPGTVVKQKPEAGEQLEQGQAVGLTIAVALPKVPDVLGRTVAEATSALEEAGFEVKVGEPVADETHETGKVAAQDPKAGSPLQKKSTVTIQASSGRAAIEIPKLVGMSLTNAQKEAEKAALKLTVQWVSMAETATYVVLRQTPEPGTTAPTDAEVKIVVNR